MCLRLHILAFAYMLLSERMSMRLYYVRTAFVGFLKKACCILSYAFPFTYFHVSFCATRRADEHANGLHIYANGYLFLWFLLLRTSF